MGIFKCGVHSYTCDDPEEWDQHLADEIHTTHGTAPCNMCGLKTEFKFTGKKGKVPPALCKQCKEIAIEGLE